MLKQENYIPYAHMRLARALVLELLLISMFVLECENLQLDLQLEILKMNTFVNRWQCKFMAILHSTENEYTELIY